MKTKDFLIEHGLSDKYRKDVYLIIGMMYDKVQESGIIKEEYYIEAREYLENNKSLLNNKDYLIVTFNTIKERFLELSFDNGLVLGNKIDKNNIGTMELPKMYFDNICYNFNNALLKEVSRKHLRVTNWSYCHGIYGIFKESEVIYIGKTNNCFKDRFVQHRNNVKNNLQSFLYDKIRLYLSKNIKINFYPIVIIEELKIIRKFDISEDELNAMELALITVYKPECNIEGRITSYVWRTERNDE